MANIILFDTIGSTFENELSGGFAFQAMDQKDERDVLLQLSQEVQNLRLMPVCTWVLGYNKVKEP